MRHLLLEKSHAVVSQATILNQFRIIEHVFREQLALLDLARVAALPSILSRGSSRASAALGQRFRRCRAIRVFDRNRCSRSWIALLLVLDIQLVVYL